MAMLLGVVMAVWVYRDILTIQQRLDHANVGSRLRRESVAEPQPRRGR